MDRRNSRAANIRHAKMQIVRMTRQVSNMIKNKLLRHKRAVTRTTITEEELDNIANEALEAVLHCK